MYSTLAMGATTHKVRVQGGSHIAAALATAAAGATGKQQVA
jgi:hypothetical protein